MKKNNLFKAIGIVILAYVLISWIVPIIYSITGTEADVSYQIGIIPIFSVILETFSGFGTVVLFVLLVGAFYGVLKATGAYDKMMDFLTTKASGKEKAWLVTIIILMAVISSVSGLDLGLLIVFPILIGFIVKIGYDKLVALSATVGATIMGMYGATFAGTLYGINNSILGLETFDQIVVKILFLVLGVAALIIFVLMYAKNKKLGVKAKSTSKSSSKSKAVKADSKKDSAVKTKKSTAKSTKTKTKKERGVLPALVVMGILLLVIFLGTTYWEGIFGSNWFSTAHETWIGLTVGDFDILNKLFGGIEALGTWNSPLRFQTYSILLVIAMVVLAIIYRTSPKDSFEGFVDGIKSFVVPTIVTILACSVFVFVYYYPVLTPITSLLLEATDSFNVALSGIYTIINSLFYVDYYYLAYSVLYTVTTIYDDTAILSIISVMFTNLYSLVMLIAPTSVLLLVSLAISDTNYTTWVKYIWKLALVLLVISFAIIMIMFGSIAIGIISLIIAIGLFVILNVLK